MKKYERLEEIFVYYEWFSAGTKVSGFTLKCGQE